MAAAQLARHRSISYTKPPSIPSSSKPSTPIAHLDFEPCTATASLLLYAQGSSVLCLHHDTLALERRFQRHAEKIQLISVDNVSERGAGRLVVSYDVGQTAIVWDLFTGHEVSRFASFEHIRVASWMRNGNVAFGNGKGEVILFEPSTSEHISARTIYDPITALAPSADCKTYAIGYNNGSILLAALQPSFTILHTLTTSRAPSPIVQMAWHASSSKQKSDMLATQTSDGDLRVWSVAKPSTSEVPRVIRALKRSETFSLGPNWIAWSKNGRIIQYSQKETWAWDVRTKHVTYEPVPTVEGVKGLANYGPTATFFTLGPNHTVQQYDIENPQLVASVQHLPVVAPPTPPEESRAINSTSESEDDVAVLSPIRKTTYEMNAIETTRRERADMTSPMSSLSHAESLSSRTSSSKGRLPTVPSPKAKTAYSGTTFSMGTMSMSQSQAARDNGPPTSSSWAYPSTMKSPVSVSNTSQKSFRKGSKGSRLKQEVLNSPEEAPVIDLFPYVRERLSDVPYRPPRPIDESHLTPDDLRRQMLSVVFGWEEDIEDLVRDELSRHPPGSQNAVLLSKWLNDDPDHMASIMSSGTPSSLDWMMLALSGIGNHAQAAKMAQAMVQKMLESGDIHAAATILMGLGDRNDAIEVYVIRNYFMEAILLTCLLMPCDWQRQSHLVRRWGEHVVENSQQHLAIRCFACTGVEPSEPWTSPTAQLATGFEQAQRVAAQKDLLLEAPTPIAMLAPASPAKSGPGGSRMTVKNSALKLMTSFGPPQSGAQFRFPGLKSDDRTPTNGPGVTPIAESAIGESALSPGGLGSYRMNNVRSLNSALSARTLTPGGRTPITAGGKTATPGGFSRHRLPSIGETPIDATSPMFPAPKPLPTPDNSSGSDKEGPRIESHHNLTQAVRQAEQPVLTLSSARYEPSKETPKQTPVTAVPQTAKKFLHQGPPSPTQGILERMKESSRSRNGSRDRKPDGLQLQRSGMESSKDYVSGDSSAYHPTLRRSNTVGTHSTTQFDSQSENRSPPTTAHSFRSTTKSPSVSGRSIDQYISSLEEAHYYSKQHKVPRQASRERNADGSHRSRSKHRLRAPSEEGRGRSGHPYIPPAKRSPSSPVPMSPEDYGMYNASVESLDSYHQIKPEAGPGKSRGRSQPRTSHSKARSGSKSGDNYRRRSPSRTADGVKRSKVSSRVVSRRQSLDRTQNGRGRSRSKAKRNRSGLRSPSSPKPMSPSGSEYVKTSEAEEHLRIVSENRHRLRSQQRSKSRRPERGTSARRDPSPDRRRLRDRSNSRPGIERETTAAKHHHNISANRQGIDRHEVSERSVDLAPQYDFADVRGLDIRSASNPQFLSERSRKELAAAELEARRLSLARRPSAPAIPLPGHAAHQKSASMSNARSLADIGENYQGKYGAPAMSRSEATSDLASSSSFFGNDASNAPRGLPSTPRAMRHPTYSSDYGDPGTPAVPDIPDGLATLSGDVYKPEGHPPFRRSMSAPVPEMSPDEVLPFVPSDLPTHPAFNHQLPGSRSNSRTRTFSPSRREPSRERARVSPAEPPPSSLVPAPLSVAYHELNKLSKINTTNLDAPPLLPELQHLQTPPPPPPPPSHPHSANATPYSANPQSAISTMSAMIKIGIDGENGVAEPQSASTSQMAEGSRSGRSSADHRRGRSVNENFAGRIRTFTDRLRSTSRGKNARSPPTESSENPSPYESLPPLMQQSFAERV